MDHGQQDPQNKNPIIQLCIFQEVIFVLYWCYFGFEATSTTPEVRKHSCYLRFISGLLLKLLNLTNKSLLQADNCLRIWQNNNSNNVPFQLMLKQVTERQFNEMPNVNTPLQWPPYYISIFQITLFSIVYRWKCHHIQVQRLNRMKESSLLNVKQQFLKYLFLFHL